MLFFFYLISRKCRNLMLRVSYEWHLKKLARKLVRKKVKKFAFDHCKTCSERFVIWRDNFSFIFQRKEDKEMSEKRCYTVQELQEILRMCTLIFWMMTEGKMQNFLKKHFMRKRIWIHRCMHSRKIIMHPLLMKSILNFWQKCWQIQRCGHYSIRWRRQWSNEK